MTMPEIIPNWHPIFVHFTIALLSVATVLFVAGKITKNETLTKAGHINLWIGAVLTIGTVLAGWDAYNTVAHDGPSHAAMTDHRNWALPTAAMFLGLALWSAMAYRKTVQPGILFLILIILASGSLVVTGFKGGEAVYRHGLGVMSLPQVEGDGGHGSHDHGDEVSHEKRPEMTIEETQRDGGGHHDHGDHPH